MNLFRLYKRYLLYKIKNKKNIDLEINTNQDSLEDLFDRFGTDKKGHGYTEFYETHFHEGVLKGYEISAFVSLL